jgi:hypothetical protein
MQGFGNCKLFIIIFASGLHIEMTHHYKSVPIIRAIKTYKGFGVALTF